MDKLQTQIYNDMSMLIAKTKSDAVANQAAAVQSAVKDPDALASELYTLVVDMQAHTKTYGLI